MHALFSSYICISQVPTLYERILLGYEGFLVITKVFWVSGEARSPVPIPWLMLNDLIREAAP